jgi:FkbM family methyltransferase
VSAVIRGAGRALRQRLMSDRERAIEEWKASGRESLRLDYPLDKSALVVDAGGYAGQWASDIVARFLCRVHVYEPVPGFAQGIRDRFAANPLVTVHEVGLAGETREAKIELRGTGSTIFGRDGAGALSTVVRLVRAADAFAEAGIERVDLLKLNVEGAEYEVLENLAVTEWLPRIRFLQIQFHDIGAGSDARMRALQAWLGQTHQLMWQYELVWESWRRREQ